MPLASNAPFANERRRTIAAPDPAAVLGPRIRSGGIGGGSRACALAVAVARVDAVGPQRPRAVAHLGAPRKAPGKASAIGVVACLKAQ